MAHDADGYTVHFIAVIRNGDGNIRFQKQGSKHKLNPGHVATAFHSAAKSAEEAIREFFCKADDGTPSRD